jgi:hypothetical protein
MEHKGMTLRKNKEIVPRRFLLHDGDDGLSIAAFGVVFGDGTAIARSNTDHASTTFFNDVNDLLVTNTKNHLVWIDR